MLNRVITIADFDNLMEIGKGKIISILYYLLDLCVLFRYISLSYCFIVIWINIFHWNISVVHQNILWYELPLQRFFQYIYFMWNNLFLRFGTHVASPIICSLIHLRCQMNTLMSNFYCITGTCTTFHIHCIRFLNTSSFQAKYGHVIFLIIIRISIFYGQGCIKRLPFRVEV